MQWELPTISISTITLADDAWDLSQRFLSIKLSIRPAGVKGYSFSSTFPFTTTVFAWSMILRGYRPPHISLLGRTHRKEKMSHLLLSQYEISQLGHPFLGWCREVRVVCPRTRSVGHAPAYLELT